MNNHFFGANHAPIGAFSSFTLGFPGKSGGLGMELQRPADTNIYIGTERREGGTYQILPFREAKENESRRYDLSEEDSQPDVSYVSPFIYSEVIRTYDACSDRWEAGDLSFTIYSQVTSVPDPACGDTEALKAAIIPAVWGELTIDNRGCQTSRTAFFGLDGIDAHYGLRRFEKSGLTGIGQGGSMAVFTDAPAGTGIGFVPECILGEEDRENWQFGNGNTAMLLFDVPADTVFTAKLAFCFFREGTATYGLEGRYYYTRFFEHIEAVGEYALQIFETVRKQCVDNNRQYQQPHLTSEQYFMLCHSIHSYYASTQLLDIGGKPVWLVNEGEFRMMNTLDLTVDQLFFEMRMNPWTVKNELEFYYHNYSYEDTVFLPGAPETTYPGGLTFCHDMGNCNQFSPKGHSSYEKCGLTGCFSYMSHEQVVNWLCCALVYIEQSGDRAWAEEYMPVIERCFQSMLNRDHPNPSLRNGVMGADSSKTKGGAEITTYDSLDTSLGQSRNNIYLAGKCFACYTALENLFRDCGKNGLADVAHAQALKCAATVTEHMNGDGYIPAVLGEGNDSRIIPAIEGLVFPLFTGCSAVLSEEGEYREYVQALKQHFVSVMEKGICLFPDGGWKLSSTSDNSWLSKIYLCEFVARHILGFDAACYTDEADKAHTAWLTHPEHSYWCWSDQIVAGNISASKYYPRGVTSILWLLEQKRQ